MEQRPLAERPKTSSTALVSALDRLEELLLISNVEEVPQYLMHLRGSVQDEEEGGGQGGIAREIGKQVTERFLHFYHEIRHEVMKETSGYGSILGNGQDGRKRMRTTEELQTLLVFEDGLL